MLLLALVGVLPWSLGRVLLLSLLQELLLLTLLHLLRQSLVRKRDALLRPLLEVLLRRHVSGVLLGSQLPLSILPCHEVLLTVCLCVATLVVPCRRSPYLVAGQRWQQVLVALGYRKKTL